MPRSEAKPKIPNKLTVRATDQTLAPHFATAIQCEIAPDIFRIDFMFADKGKGILLGRYAITPQHAKRLQDLLNRQIALYEGRFGAIADASEPPKEKEPERGKPGIQTKPRITGQ